MATKRPVVVRITVEILKVEDWVSKIRWTNSCFWKYTNSSAWYKISSWCKCWPRKRPHNFATCDGTVSFKRGMKDRMFVSVIPA